MSTTLLLRVHQFMAGNQQPVAGAVADVLAIPDDAENTHLGVIIPVGDRAVRAVEVRPGRYFVRVYLPSGRVLTTRVTAEPNMSTPVLLEHKSPREWLAWQALQSRAPLAQPRTGGGTRALGERAEPNTIRLSLLDFGSGSPAALPWNKLSVANGSLRSKVPELTSSREPNQWDTHTASFVVEPALGQAPVLKYGLIRRGTVRNLIALPGWTCFSVNADALVSGGTLPEAGERWSGGVESAPIDIAVPAALDESVRVAVHDPNMGALLGYVAAGNLPTAALMLGSETPVREQSELALLNKLVNPYAAAVGAYVLLQTDTDGPARWHQWLENLANLFPWFPDAAVLLASLRLRLAKTDEDVDAAREWFSISLTRGVPVLAPVLRCLLDGVTTLAEDPDVDAQGLQGALPLIRAVCRSVVSDQIFTIISGGEGDAGTNT